jgi:hypothetical protein
VNDNTPLHRDKAFGDALKAIMPLRILLLEAALNACRSVRGEISQPEIDRILEGFNQREMLALCRGLEDLG